MEIAWCAETNLLIRVDVEELGSGNADLSSGIGEIAERTCEDQTSLVCESSYPVGSSPCARRQVRQLQIP
jgi:hypothetical protein